MWTRTPPAVIRHHPDEVIDACSSVCSTRLSGVVTVATREFYVHSQYRAVSNNRMTKEQGAMRQLSPFSPPDSHTPGGARGGTRGGLQLRTGTQVMAR